MKRFRLLAILAVLAVTISSAFADGFIIIDEVHWRPAPRPVSHPISPSVYVRPYAPLEVTAHHVDVKINGQIATTTVDQDFYNPNPDRLEGTYIFPIPHGAQIDKFSMEIAGQKVDAELLAADKARDIYENIVRKLRDPALLEYAGQDVFKVRVFPIEPNSHKHITLSYSEVLKADAGLVKYSYPLNTEKYSAKPIDDVSIKVQLENPHSIKSIFSPSHLIDIKRDGPHRATVGYEANDIRPDTDFTLYFAPEQDEIGLNLLTSKTSGEDGYFLLMASPGMDVKEKQVVMKDIVFVLDTSGSMSGKKITQAKKALQFCVDNLNDGDRFELLRFSTEVEPLFNKLVDASSANRDKAGEFVKDLHASGATAIDDALQTALSLRPPGSDRPFVVIFLTDGMPTIGVTDESQILAHVKQKDSNRTRIFCFGIGTDVNTHLLDKLTEQTRGYSQYVLPDEDLEIKVSNFYAKIKEPVLADPTLTFTGDIRATKMYPSPLPDLFKGDQLVLAGRYSGHGNSAIVIEGAVNGQTRKFTYETKFPSESSENSFIPRLWATRRVGYLLDEIRLHGENAELRDEVTSLARQYGIVTPYTAYLIVEDESRRSVPLTMRSMQEMDKDAAVRAEAEKSWNYVNSALDGSQAIAGAQLNDKLKNANVTEEIIQDKNVGGGGGRRGGRGGGGGGGAAGAFAANSLGLTASGAAALPSMAPSETKARQQLMNYAGQARFVNGHNFFQNGSQWLDAEVQNNQQAHRTHIQFDSTEYFVFAARHPQALPWLALGPNIQFVLDGTIYDISE